jgi:hypothetical protein
MKTCQAKSSATSWDDLIEFTEAKIQELKESLKVFKQSKENNFPWNKGKSAAQVNSAPRSRQG